MGQRERERQTERRDRLRERGVVCGLWMKLEGLIIAHWTALPDW